MGNFKKFYVGGIQTEEEAARVYDRLSILNNGIEVRLNHPNTNNPSLHIQYQGPSFK